ncbi:hypothetical protein V6N11_074556 [Hibiscus sabdariffa]|uniref:Pentatricopeptide repeat-containing protein n=1 Tax=Hibiscus sabdariffa TaxID=183260 RepID=A0ABR2R3W8_9ROSI
MKETSEVLPEMSRRRSVPDEITYNTSVNRHCKDGNLHQALVSHAEMVRNGLLQTYTSLINSMCKAGNMSRAMEFSDQMHVRGVRPNETTYAVIWRKELNQMQLHIHSGSVRAQEGDIKKAFHLHDEMVRIVLINGLNKQARTREADRRNRNPDEAAYSVIIHGHCRCGNTQKACDLYKEMVKPGLLPHTVTVIALVKALFMVGKTDVLSHVIANILRSCKLTDAELTKNNAWYSFSGTAPPLLPATRESASFVISSRQKFNV